MKIPNVNEERFKFCEGHNVVITVANFSLKKYEKCLKMAQTLLNFLLFFEAINWTNIANVLVFKKEISKSFL